MYVCIYERERVPQWISTLTFNRFIETTEKGYL